MLPIKTILLDLIIQSLLFIILILGMWLGEMEGIFPLFTLLTWQLVTWIAYRNQYKGATRFLSYAIAFSGFGLAIFFVKYSLAILILLFETLYYLRTWWDLFLWKNRPRPFWSI